MNSQKARRLVMKSDWEYNTQKNRIGIESKVSTFKEEPKDNSSIFEILENKLKELSHELVEPFCMDRFLRNKSTIEDITKLKWQIDSKWRKEKLLPENQTKSMKKLIEKNKKAGELKKKN